jgi:hypothetical protein
MTDTSRRTRRCSSSDSPFLQIVLQAKWRPVPFSTATRAVAYEPRPRTDLISYLPLMSCFAC